MSENPLLRIGSFVWGFVVGVIGLLVIGCLYLNIGLSLISLAIWLLPFALAVVATVFLDRGNGLFTERVRSLIWCSGAMLCLPWAILLRTNGEVLPAWLVFVLTFGFRDEPVPGPRGPEVNDISTMMGTVAFVSFGGFASFVVGAYTFLTERFRTAKERDSNVGAATETNR